MKVFAKLLRWTGYVLFRPVWCLERLFPRSKNVWVFGAWWCLWAKYAFLTSSVVDVNKFFLNGCKQIWLWHAMPLKKILNSDDAYTSVSVARRVASSVGNPYMSFHPYATVTSSQFFTPFLKEAFGIAEKKIWNTGLPRCDAFFSSRKESYTNTIREKFPGAKIFLYLPTFRMSSLMDGKPFSPFEREFDFENQEFARFFEKENAVMLYKPHFVYSGVDVSIQSDRFRFIKDNDFDDLYVLLNSVDALITDYSSVYFDFLASRKPIFLLPFDYEEYTRKSRSHYFDMYKELHGVFCKNWKEFYERAGGDATMQIQTESLNTDRIKFAEFVDGNSAEKIFNFVKAH